MYFRSEINMHSVSNAERSPCVYSLSAYACFVSYCGQIKELIADILIPQKNPIQEQMKFGRNGTSAKNAEVFAHFTS